MAITDWPQAERPREKLLALGTNVLSDAELLAILLGSGTRGKSAVELARTLLLSSGGLRALLNTTMPDMLNLPGIGRANYARLQAALEISRRCLNEKLQRQNVLHKPELVHAFLQAQLQDLTHEVFACLTLDTKLRLITFDILFHGTLDQSVVYPREVIKLALKRNAAAVIIAHNHPSGIAQPSNADILLTQQLHKALAHVGVRMLDHVIIGDGEVVSLAERNLF
jgi:DNA repair protein RadC